VSVDVTTPEVGGISPVDLELAEEADKLADSLQSF
jgi:pterin-4a-carbinolamine dehydratase